jgi:hypothetical protein
MHNVLYQMNLAKFFWNRKEKRYDEMSGNLFLTLRAIAQKPLGKDDLLNLLC